MENFANPLSVQVKNNLQQVSSIELEVFCFKKRVVLESHKSLVKESLSLENLVYTWISQIRRQWLESMV